MKNPKRKINTPPMVNSAEYLTVSPNEPWLYTKTGKDFFDDDYLQRVILEFITEGEKRNPEYTFDKVIKTKNLVNVVVASKHPRPQWLDKTKAKKLADKGILKIDFASNDKDDVDIVLVAIGETPFIEVLGAVDILRESIKSLNIRVIVVNDLFTLSKDHPHGLSDDEYNKLFTTNKPVLINYHGYSSVIRDLIYDRVNKNISVHGYMEEGNITTPFDMRVVNEIDRFHLVIDILNKIPRYFKTGDVLIDWCEKMLKEHVRYIVKHGEDMPYIKNWYFKDGLDKGI